jgi:hypothetical protein
MIDDRTIHRSYALPHPENLLSEDVARIKDSFEDIDVDVDDLYEKTDTIQSGSVWHAQSTGSGNTYEVMLDPAPFALAPGQFVHMEAHVTNFGPATLNINSIGAKSIKRTDGSELEAEDIQLNGIAYLVYNGDHFQLLNVPGMTLEQESRFLSNDFRNYDLMQTALPGAIAIEKGWSDSFGVANEQGADEVNSTGEQHDSVNKLYHGIPGSINSNSDKDYANESDFGEQEWTNVNQVTSQATVASGTTVTLSSGTWPTNAANSRISFDGGATFFDIVSRDSGTQITLNSSTTDGTFDYTIRMTIIESSQFFLNKIAAPVDSNTVLLLHMDGSNGSTTFVDSSLSNHSITVAGNAQIDNSKSKFGGTSCSFDGVSGTYLTILDNGDFDFPGDYTIDFWFNVSSTQGGGFITHHDGSANHGVFINRITVGKIQVQDDRNGIYVEYGSGLNDGNWHHFAWVRQGSGSNNNTIYIDGSSPGSFTATGDITINIDLAIGYYILSNNNYLDGHIDELRVSKGIARWTSNFTPPNSQYHNDQNVINEYVSTVDTFVQKEDTSTWFDINSANVTESLNSQNAYYWLCFDPVSDYGDGTEVKIFNQTNSVWRKIARNNNGTWQYNNNSDHTIVETWVDAATNDMLHAVSEAISSQAANRMTGLDLTAITNIEWEGDNGFSSTVNSIARGVTLHSTSVNQIPSVDQYRIIYDSEPNAMDLRSKTFDPDSPPKKAFLWAKAEHSDIDGPGTFYVSRNEGTDWEVAPMVQQGKPLSGNIKILRSIHKFTTGSGSQDLRCRYATAQGKVQKLHSWGLQALD